jgi:environmental stress-induced protein Ves
MGAFRPLPAAARRTEAWANGAGTTTVLDSGPAIDAGADAWRWRLSIASIDRDAGFSTLPGVRRQFAPLDAPLTLVFPDGHERHLLRLEATRFDGAHAPRALLADAPTRAFNLMLRGDAEGELLARPLNGAMVLPLAGNARWFFHLLAGQAELRIGEESFRAAQDDSVWIEATGTLRIEGGGEVVLVRIGS